MIRELHVGLAGGRQKLGTLKALLNSISFGHQLDSCTMLSNGYSTLMSIKKKNCITVFIRLVLLTFFYAGSHLVSLKNNMIYHSKTVVVTGVDSSLVAKL